MLFEEVVHCLIAYVYLWFVRKLWRVTMMAFVSSMFRLLPAIRINSGLMFVPQKPVGQHIAGSKISIFFILFLFKMILNVYL